MPRKKTRPALSTISSVVFAITLVFMGLFLDTSHTFADTMGHEMQNTQNCATGCTSNQGLALKQEVTVLKHKKATPVIPPNEPYYTQFQSLDFPKPIFPPELLLRASFKPPDLTLLSSVFRF